VQLSFSPRSQVYGMHIQGLAKDMGIALEDAKRIFRDFNEKFPGYYAIKFIALKRFIRGYLF
jgi:hypothetical protein